MEGKEYTSLITIIKNIPDKRQQAKVLHPLVDIIFIAIVATLAGADDWEEMQWFAEEKEEWFRKYISLPNGVPSHDTIQRVFQWINPKIFVQDFIVWTQMVSGIVQRGIVAIDGKTMCGTKDEINGKKALHIVSAWFSENKMVLGQVKTEEKSNEIKAIPELIDMLDVTGCIVTLDAMGTQVDIVEKIVKKKADYALVLKGNQGILHQEVKEFYDQLEIEKDFEEYGVEYYEEKEKNHGRIESRSYYLSTELNWLDARKDWQKLQGIGKVEYISETSNGQRKTETRYYITSLVDVKEFARAVRGHWGIESMHWSLDVTFREDAKRTRKDHAPENLSLLHRLAYNILKLDVSKKKRSLKGKRRMAGWNIEFLEKLLVGASVAK